MKHIRQPIDSNLCGQSVIAMLNGITLDESIKILNTEGKTKLKQLLSVISGWNNETEKMIVVKSNKWKQIDSWPSFAIIRLKHDRGLHWLIKNGVKIYDSNLKKPVMFSDYVRMVQVVGRMTSYCKLIKP